MQRYLLRFAYKGKGFTGFQKTLPRLAFEDQSSWYKWNDRKTVQGALEQALLYLKPKHQVVVQGSSRTDSGVHAWSSTATVDLVRSYVRHRPGPPPNPYYCPLFLTQRLNQIFGEQQLPIR